MNNLNSLVCSVTITAMVIVLLPTTVEAEVSVYEACWGQATKVFARTGEMGEHASQQASPRLGLRNLARALNDGGVIPDDSLQALGQFVAAELGLTIEACEAMP